MSNDDDWVADVRRWVAAGSPNRPSQITLSSSTAEANDEVIGYEAAHPGLQAAHWPEAQRSDFGSLNAV